MKTKFAYLAMLSWISASAFGLSMVNAPCLSDQFKPYADLVQKVNLFPEDNRTILEKHFQDFKLNQKDVEQIRSTLGQIICPGTTNDNHGSLNGLVIGSNDTIITNVHALRENNGTIRDPLSECTFRTQDEISAGLPGHKFALGDGEKGLADAVKSKHLALGTHNAWQADDDWAVIKLKTPVQNARPFKLPAKRPELHSCDVAKPDTCQKLISLSVHDHLLPGLGTSPFGSSVIQSSNLYDVDLSASDSKTASRLFSNRSSLKGDSGGVSFLANEDGSPVRIYGSLLPVGLDSRGPDVEDNGKAYDHRIGLATELVGLDGTLAKAIKEISGTK